MVWPAKYGALVLALWFLAWLWFELPWYLGPLPVIIAGTASALVWARSLAHRTLPALDPHTRAATVTGHSTDTWDYDNRSERTNIHVRVETPDGAFDSVLADLVAAPDVERFAAGSRWSVRTFTGNTARVFLGDAHDDVRRFGYHLDGVRYPSEHRQWFRPKPGSPFARHRFRG